ncbi:MAG TPA: RHS repeat-associated core domain-containing protein [Verrucomicrobiae bacterium]|jgi:RHS repeat-associated protein|nr:RHS repeat-associated core domain-containing protein [Verrucomicrobiae bacterium]
MKRNPVFVLGGWKMNLRFVSGAVLLLAGLKAVVTSAPAQNTPIIWHNIGECVIETAQGTTPSGGYEGQTSGYIAPLSNSTNEGTLEPPNYTPINWTCSGLSTPGICWPSASTVLAGTTVNIYIAAVGSGCAMPIGPVDEDDDFPPPFVDCGGMPVWRVSEPNLSLWLLDEPLGYQPSIGSRISLTLDYKQHEETAGMDSLIFSFGCKWNCSWLSYVATNGCIGTNFSGSNQVYYANGGTRTFLGTNDYLTETRLIGNMTNGYYVYYADGSVDFYAYFVFNSAIDLAFLSVHTNPQGQSTHFYYSVAAGCVQLQYVVDATGGTNTLYYNGGAPNLVTKVTDRYNRSAYFAYNGSGCLTNIIDVGGITNSIAYNANFYATNLTTPYGQTTFQFTDSPPGAAPPNGRSVLITDPDGSSELYLGSNGAPGVAVSYPTNAVPVSNPLPNEFENTNLNVRNTFHWGKRQYQDLPTTNISAMTSNDFHLATMKHWLLTSSGQLGQTLSLEVSPSPDILGGNQGEITWYDYAGKTNNQYEGTQFLPQLVANVLADGTTRFSWTARNGFGAVTTNINTYGLGATTSLRTNIFTYSTNAVDLLTLTNALNIQVMSNAFNTNHQILTNYDALNQKTVCTYDSSNRLSTITTPTSLVITNSYGTNGYLAQQISVGFATNSYTYSNGLVLTHTDPRNMTVTNTWDNLQRLTSTTYPDGTYVSNQYTILDRTATKDRLTNWTYYGYDSLRHNIAVTNALGHYDLFTYCSCGALESVQDALGYLTHYYYDNQSRLTNVLYSDSYTLTYGYNLIGQLTNIFDGSGISVTNVFDNQGLLTLSSNAAGQLKAVSYDVLDRPTNVVNANGVSVGRLYDSLNRVVTNSYPDGGTESFGYSAFGLVAYTNQLTNFTHFGYDAERRKIAETNALNNFTQYAYDAASDLISLTDPNNHTTQWGYDLYGRVTNKVDATGTSILTNQYDADNRLINRWSLAKSNTVYAYDAVGNLTNVTYYHTNLPVSFSYDNMNELTSMSDAIGTTSFTYTPGHQLASENGPWASDTVSYTYTDRLRTALDLQQPNASAWVQDYSYDLAGRMTGITSPAGTFSYSYSPGVGAPNTASSLISKLALPNGAWITNTYDGNARMLGTWLYNSSASALDSSVYTNNVGNQRVSVTRNGENTAAYTYDVIGQVLGDVASEGTTNRMNEQLHYAFDAAGNLTYRTNNTLIENFQVNTVNELTANTNGGRLTVMGTATSQNSTTVTVNSSNALVYGDATFAATNMPITSSYTAIAGDSYGRHSTNTVTVSIATNTTYQYDGNGNLTNDGLRSFAYDNENQLIQVWVANQWFSQFAYDAKMRRRIRQEYTWQSGAWVQTNEVYYVYDGNVVIQERNINNLPATTYTRGNDLSSSLEGSGGIGGLLSMTLNFESETLNSNSFFYHADGNGNVTMLINPSQYIVAKYLYDAFGNVLSAAGSLAQANLYRFSSKEAHLNSGLVYYLYRYYDPNLQRWLNRDPILENGAINLYSYVNNSPISGVDPFGEGPPPVPPWESLYHPFAPIPSPFPTTPSNPYSPYLPSSNPGSAPPSAISQFPSPGLQSGPSTSLNPLNPSGLQLSPPPSLSASATNWPGTYTTVTISGPSLFNNSSQFNNDWTNILQKPNQSLLNRYQNGLPLFSNMYLSFTNIDSGKYGKPSSLVPLINYNF